MNRAERQTGEGLSIDAINQIVWWLKKSNAKTSNFRETTHSSFITKNYLCVIMSFLFLKTNNSDWIDLVRSVCGVPRSTMNIRTAVMSSGTLWFQFSCTQIKSTQRNEGNGRVQLWQKEFCERMKAMNNRTWIYSVLDFPQLYSAGRQHMRTVRVRTIAARETQCSYQLGRRSKGRLIYLIIHANHTKSAHLSFTFIIWLDGITLTVKR